jgi:2-polyprenyl-6-methoxyphenol hydroxylase-like FAD-dependent oxidoreductase
MSGMGTTLAMYGAYNLAGALTRHSEDIEGAFTEYEERMRPLVTQAQKLMPFMFRMLNPDTAWGVWLVDSIIKFMMWTGLVKLLMKLKKPDKESVILDDFGFRDLEEWSD